MQLKQFLLQLYIFFAGACVGSFLNVCIYRLPQAKSIVRPRSMCPKCGNQIRAYDNIPILSFLWLRGHCRQCNTPISLRYPLVEAMSGLFALSIYLKFGLSPGGIVYYVFIATLIVITYIDIDYQIIPDVISLPGIPIFFIASLLLPYELLFPFENYDPLVKKIMVSVGLPSYPIIFKLLHSTLGFLIGGGSLYIIAQAYCRLKQIEGMGGGDIKLLAMIGVLIGWTGVLTTIFVGSALGMLVGIASMVHQRRLNMQLRIPFGPFLAIGAITYIYFGVEIIHWYFNQFR
ncbi:prepilin peptidase [Thermodesulfobacteriota bacterium]